MILSLLPVSKRKLPFGCITTKKPTGTCTGALVAPDWSALLAIVTAPELNAYIFMPAGDCANAATTVIVSNRAMTIPNSTGRLMVSSSSGPRLKGKGARRVWLALRGVSRA